MSFKKIAEATWEAKTDETVDFYWKWPMGIMRSKWLANHLKDNHSFDSVFEVGLMGGRNVNEIKNKMPSIRVGGLDVNESSVKFARDNIEGAFYNMSAFDIDKLEGEWDIIFTMGVMIHLPPDQIEEFCKKALDKAKYAVIHIECIGKGQIVNGPEELNPTKKITNRIKWRPNIPEIYKNIGVESVKHSKLPSEIKRIDCSHYIEVLK